MSELVLSPDDVGFDDDVATGVSRRRASWLIRAALLVVGVVSVTAVLGRWITPHDPFALNVTQVLWRPDSTHWLGTDALGRDVFSRLIIGARTALLGPLVVAFGSMLIGNALGLLAGYRGGWIDAVIMRWVDLMWAVPNLLVVIIVAGVVNGGYWLAVVMLMIFNVPSDTRVSRGATLEQVPRPYVEAARTLGFPRRRIMFVHIWPNISAISVANAFVHFSGALVALSSLSFLGLGAGPGAPDWGVMLTEARPLLFANPVAALAPAGAIVFTAASMNLVGDWLYERLSLRGAVR